MRKDAMARWTIDRSDRLRAVVKRGQTPAPTSLDEAIKAATSVAAGNRGATVQFAARVEPDNKVEF